MSRCAQPHPYAISAQLVNSPVTGLQQYHYGAIHPFLPTHYYRNYRKAVKIWQPSELGLYPEAMLPLFGDLINMNSSYRSHPWLLLTNSSYNTAELKGNRSKRSFPWLTCNTRLINGEDGNGEDEEPVPGIY
ncbi:hypothetical protein M434DRAFT_39204 [Hypoxylon sp. CO27-5]|nr:hypothetical protein M434DRAFT_39204 [Hypoxylon sp. CO27-5]